MTQPVSRPRGGVRVPVPPPSVPRLSAEAAQMVAGLQVDSQDELGPALEKLMRTITAKPSRAGAEVLTFTAGACRNAGNVEAAERLTVLRALIVAQCNNDEAWQSGIAKMQKVTETAIRDAYASGFAAGQAELKKAAARRTAGDHVHRRRQGQDRWQKEMETQIQPGGKP